MYHLVALLHGLINGAEMKREWMDLGWSAQGSLPPSRVVHANFQMSLALSHEA
jgi:hypothetical protein